MSEGSTRVINGVRITQGTPAEPLTAPALFLKITRVTAPGKPERTLASLSMARPRPGTYVIKELIAEMDLEPQAAVKKAVAIALRGDVSEIYLNADLDRLPVTPVHALG